jgi:hypothetical protein
MLDVGEVERDSEVKNVEQCRQCGLSKDCNLIDKAKSRRCRILLNRRQAGMKRRKIKSTPDAEERQWTEDLNWRL